MIVVETGTKLGSVIPVVTAGPEEPSGLADMLRQFIEQTIAGSPRKARLARRLSGQAIFRSAEDEELCVRITFAGARIELEDAARPHASDAMVTADFLTMAHLAAGKEGPFRLLLQRKLKARFSLAQIPFLFAMLRFMQIEAPRSHAAWVRWAWPAAAAAAGAAYWYVRTHF